MRRCEVFVCLVFSALMVSLLLNATSSSDISASERMLTHLERPQRRALRMIVDLQKSKKERKILSVSIC